MAQNYFAPTQNAMAGMTKNLVAADQMQKQNAMMQTRQGAFQNQDRGQGMQAMGAAGDIQGMNALGNLGEYEQGQAQGERERAMEKIKILGPLSEQLLSMPEDQLAQAYPGIAQRVNEMLPGTNAPLEYSPETRQGMESVLQIYRSMQSPKDEQKGNQTDIWRYAGLAEQQWKADNPGVPMPAKLKMQAMLDIKRAQAPEAGAVAGAKAAVQLETGEDLAASKERGKLAQQLKLKPAIQAAVKLAEEAARAKGETLTTLARAEAALPGLMETVDILKELAPIATSTFGGKVFDIAIKESGFGSTKGATAKAKFIAIVMNQVLPLLKPTFGAAFTVEEGKELKATMGDPNATPAEKIAQLEAFIAQKRRSIETAKREVSTVPSPPQGNEVQEGQIIVNPSTGERLKLVNGEFIGVQ